jgi:hypothetical protein
MKLAFMIMFDHFNVSLEHKEIENNGKMPPLRWGWSFLKSNNQKVIVGGFCFWGDAQFEAVSEMPRPCVE